jgi:uncharacterized surface protein with fasciclin (FAS1) repeats
MKLISMKTFVLQKNHIRNSLLILILAGLFAACDSDDVGGNLYTFTDQTMGQYLQADTVNFSEFTKLLDTTNVIGLLKSYGEFTCFAPTDSAMKVYYKEHGKQGLNGFTIDSLKLIAYDHLINGTILMNSDFIVGDQVPTSMSERYLMISYSKDTTYLNTTSRILQKDIVVHNGVIHKIAQVLNPSRKGLVEKVANDPNFSIFYQGLLATGLVDSMLKVEDETYDPSLYANLVTVAKDKNDWFYEALPTSRKYGYTLFMENDSIMRVNGITDLESMKEYAASIYDEVYPEDAGNQVITSRTNSLNRFIAYHIINKSLPINKLIDAYVTPHQIATSNLYEYIETLCPNTLMEVTREWTGATNLLNKYLSSTDGLHVVKITKTSIPAINGIYHELDGMLVYSYDVANMLSTKRLRFDAASFFPELTNNNMRGLGNTLPNLKFVLPRGYIDRISSSEQTVVKYLTPYYMYQDYEGDEIYLSATSSNLYDFSIITLPVPAGTYEVRFGYLTNGKRGVAQLYMDNIPTGVPLNLNTAATHASIGYVTPGDDLDDPYGYQNDKMMRNRGYMKAPACFQAPDKTWSGGENARYCPKALRKILGTYEYLKAETHVLTVRGLSGGEFMFDYLEFVPTSMLETEDVN